MTTVKNLTEAGYHIARHWNFNHRSMRGETMNHHSGAAFGELPGEWQKVLRLALSETQGIPHAWVYVVFSYDTPIGWLTCDNDLVIPDVTYSTTTTRHQRIVRDNLRRRTL